MGNYYIKLEDAPDVRRKILESSKASIHTLRGYRQIIVSRNEKLTLMNQFRAELKEVTVLLNRAESLMPVLTEREVQELQPSVEDAIVEKRKEKKLGAKKQEKNIYVQLSEVMPKKKTDVERLEEALMQIEKKLGNI